MLNAEELIKAEMLSSTFNKVENIPKIAKPGSNPWMKYVVVMGAIGLSFGIAYLINRNESKQKLKDNQNEGY